jgi:hypothetical protein
MRSPVIFRATFQQPRESTFKLSAPIGVEVYHNRVQPPQEWKARSPGTRIDFKQISAQATANTLMRQIELLHFETKLTDWEAFDRTQDPSRKLSKEDWHTDTKGNTVLTLEYQEKVKAEAARASEKLIQERKARALEGM